MVPKLTLSQLFLWASEHKWTISDNCTDRLEPLDVSMKATKEDCFRIGTLKDLSGDQEECSLPYSSKMNIVKLLGAKW